MRIGHGAHDQGRRSGQAPVRVGVIGLDHAHGLMLAGRLRLAGATIAGYCADAPRDRLVMRALGPTARRRTEREIIEDPAIDLVVTAAVPDCRGDIAVQALRHGKHVVADKPGVTDPADLARIDAAVAETGRRWWVLFGERFENRAVAEACDRARIGDVGRVVSVLGLGPHRMGAQGRPDWFWEPARSGGILVDIGAHQVDQLLAATGATTADVLWSAVGNVASPDHPRMQDVGAMVLRAGGAVGTHRVDYLSPSGLSTWGDGRLMIVGTEGTLEARTNVDVAGRRGSQHLIVVDGRGVRRVACRRRPVDWARRLLADVREGTDTLLSHTHVRAVSEITLAAQRAAEDWDEGAVAAATAEGGAG